MKQRPPIYVCIRVDEDPDPESLPTEGKPVKGKCSECLSYIWHSVFAPPEVKKMCNQCADKYTEDVLKKGEGVIRVPASVYPKTIN